MEWRRERIEAIVERGLPFLFSLQFILGSLQLLDALRVVYYPLIHGATRIMRFELGVSLVWLLLLLLVLWFTWVVWERNLKLILLPTMALIALPFMGLEASISIASILAVVAGLWYFRHFALFLRGTFFLLSVIEVTAVLHWVVFLPLGLVSPFKGLAWVETGLFYLTAYFVPLLILPILFMWVLKPLIRYLYYMPNNRTEIKYTKDISSKDATIIILIIIMCVIASYLPFLKIINPEEKNVGVDFQHYVSYVDEVQLNPLNAFKVMSGARPVFFILTYFFKNLFSLDTSTSIHFMSIFLNIMFVLSLFFLSREIFSNVQVSLLVAFFSASSYQIIINMYAYFLTNMLGLSIVFFSLWLLFKAINVRSYHILILSSILVGLIVFTHPASLDHYFMTALLCVGLNWFYDRVSDKDAEKRKFILIYIVSMVLSEFFKLFFFPGGGGISAVGTFVDGMSGLPKFWYDSIFGVRLIYGGALSPFILFIFSIIGIYYLNKDSLFELFLISLLVVTSLLYLVGDASLKSRLLFNLPIGLYAGIGFYKLFERKKSHDFIFYFLCFGVLNMIVYLFRYIINLV